MSKRGFSSARSGIFRTLAAALIVVSLFTQVAAADLSKPNAQQPTVSDGVHILTRADLSQASPPRLSALRPDVVDVTYDAGQGALISCDNTANRIRFTFDGSTPTPSSPSVPLNCTTTPAVPGQGNSYRGAIAPPDLRNATFGATVTFRIEIQQVFPSQTTLIDNNGGLYYKYRIDKSRGNMTLKVPSPAPGSSLPDAVVRDNKTPVSFKVEDNAQEAPIDQNSFAVQVDGTDRTNAFICAFTTFDVTCALDYTKMPSGFTFSVGNHKIVAVGQDMTGNAFDSAKSTLGLRVDRTPPTITNVTASPQAAGAPTGSDGKPIVSKGANVTVKADVSDPNMNNNSVTRVLASLFNTTLGKLSPAVGMHLNKTSKKWEANVTVPTDWPNQAFNVSARVVAADEAGNAAVANSTGHQFSLDPVNPVITDTPPGPFIKDTPTRVTARVTDVGSGVDPTKVQITYSNVTGKFKSPPTGVQKLSSNSFRANMTRVGSTDNYTYDIPAAEGGSVITYVITAKDKAGGPSASPTRTLFVDLTGPTITEPAPKAYRPKPPMRWEFLASDLGAGVDNASVKLFYSTGGGFQSAPATQDPVTGRFVASISPTVSDGTTVKYYAEAADKLGNIGRLYNSTNPGTVIVDTVAPTTSMTSPATSSGPTFIVAWTGTDARSGVDTFTVQARVNDGTPGIWVTVANATKNTQLEFCGEGGHKYEFRSLATDVAGNAGSFPTAPQTATTLSGAGCAEQVLVSVISPGAGAVVSGKSTPTFPVTWSASSTRTFTPTNELRISVLFSPDGGSYWHTLASNLPNTGSYSMKASELPSCTSCKIQIVATTLSGVKSNATSFAFKIVDGDAAADLDGNGLPDAWEVKYGTRLGQFSPTGDDDHDGLSNLDEARLGTDPKSKDTDGDGASDRVEARVGTDPLSASSVPSRTQSREDEFTNWYWTVPGIFLAVVILFFVGLARRW